LKKQTNKKQIKQKQQTNKTVINVLNLRLKKMQHSPVTSVGQGKNVTPD